MSLGILKHKRYDLSIFDWSGLGAGWLSVEIKTRELTIKDFISYMNNDSCYIDDVEVLEVIEPDD